MPQINQVRTNVPAQQTPAWAGALQGFGRHFSLQQEKKALGQENMMKILPALASIRALQPAVEGEPGAIDMGGGNWIKIVSPVATSQDKLADMRVKQLEYAMSPAGLAAEATERFKNDNAIMLNGLKKPGEKDKMIAEYYASSLSIHKRGTGGEGGGTVPVYDKSGEQRMAPPDVAAQLIASGQYTAEPPGKEGTWPGPVTKGLVGIPAFAGLARAAFKAAPKVIPKAIAGGGKFFGPWGTGASIAATAGLGIYDYMKNRDPSNINQAQALPGQVTKQQTMPMPVSQQQF